MIRKWAGREELQLSVPDVSTDWGAQVAQSTLSNFLKLEVLAFWIVPIYGVIILVGLSLDSTYNMYFTEKYHKTPLQIKM